MEEDLTKLTSEEVMQRSRARQMALAIIRRGKDAKIPEQYLRIKEEKFKNILAPDFHGDVAKFASSVYHDPDFLLNRKFISIDGGTEQSRIIAGYALLFRMIAYDKVGMYCSCSEMYHKFQTIKSTEEITRNDLTEQMKSYDILFISEFNRSLFSPHFETSSFFDEILGQRVNCSKPTIVSCVAPITKGSKDADAASGKSASDAGKYLSRLENIVATTDNVLRVRVKAV